MLVRDEAVEGWLETLEEVGNAVGGYDGKRVLEVGSDHAGATLRALDAHYDPIEVVGANPAFPGQRFTPRARREQLDARSMPTLPDDSFDVVVTWSAFEHVHRLDEVLAELHRVLRPGGLLYAHYGPIWSSPYGHHLWIEVGGRVLTYHNVILPSWCHLLETPQQVFEQCIPHFGEQVAEAVTRFVFEDPAQNHVLFPEYEQMVADCPFETAFFKGYDYQALSRRYADARQPERLAQLRERFGDTERFMYDGIEMLLRKQA